MSRILKSLGAVVALAVALPVMSGAAPASTASPTRVVSNSQTFQDSVGERAGAPDITTIVVSNDNTGLLTFQINLTIPPELVTPTTFTIVDIEIDSDNNPATGSTDPLDQGADYAIELAQNQVDLFKWDGKNFSRSAAGPPESTLIFANTATGPSIKISTTELGNAKKLRFNASAVAGVTMDATGNLDFSKATADFAPDLGHGLYSYDVKTAKLKLLAQQFRTAPSRPRAGGLFTAQMVAVRNDTGAALQGGTVKCSAKVGGTSLAPRTHRIANKVAKCAWAVPSSAKGQTLRGTITVVFEGLKVTRSFALPVG